MFTENQHLVEFSPIMEVSFQRTKRWDLYTHYSLRVLAYVIIIWRLSSVKTIIYQISLNFVLNQFLIISIRLKLFSRAYVKEMGDVFLKLSLLEKNCFKFERGFKNKLIN